MSRHISMKSLLAALVMLSLPLAIAPAVADEASAEHRLQQSRAITAEFASRLQGALMAAISESGPAGAITVCRDEAPRIASDLSRTSGARVRRTSLRFRNPANAPEPWQVIVLRKFEADAAQGRPIGDLEHLQAGDYGVRYMKAIPTGGVCLACHGTGLSPAIDAALSESYPHDLARGYEPGDVRGAFSVTWPAAAGAE